VVADLAGCTDMCGDFTHFDRNLFACVPDFPATVCEPETTVEVAGDDGVIECIGIGDPDGCRAPPCPVPDAGKVTVCGQLVDVETSAVIETAAGDLTVELYDALDFASDPDGALPLPYDSLVINQCGQFAVTNVPKPALGYLGIATDDAAGDDYALTGVALPVASGDRIQDLNLYATRRSTDAAWTATAGDPFGGASFSEVGVHAAIYLLDGNPVEGVRITENSAPDPASDYYFSDADPATRTTVDPAQASTGPNGTALIVDSALVNHGGEGGDLPAGCRWPSGLADAIPGVVFILERHAECD
jgi:hypothetical protein